MENKRQDITCDEDAGVPDRRQTRPRLAEVDDDVFECKVYSGGDEGGRDNQAANLHLKTRLVEGVVVHDKTTSVADYLAQAAQAESNLQDIRCVLLIRELTHHVGPRLVSDA